MRDVDGFKCHPEAFRPKDLKTWRGRRMSHRNLSLFSHPEYKLLYHKKAPIEIRSSKTCPKCPVLRCVKFCNLLPCLILALSEGSVADIALKFTWP
jgi:hypothetical protein